MKVDGMTAVASFDALRAEVLADPRPWCAGTERGAAPLSELDTLLLNAGELLALLSGARGVSMVQLWVGWDDSLPQPAFRPFVLRLLREAADDPRIAVHMSPLPMGPHLGLSAILSAATQPWQPWAGHLASFGAQAAVVAQSPYYKLLIGRVLGYSEANIVAHIEESGERLDRRALQLADEELQQLSAVPPKLPWTKQLKSGTGSRGKPQKQPKGSSAGFGGGSAGKKAGSGGKHRRK